MPQPRRRLWTLESGSTSKVYIRASVKVNLRASVKVNLRASVKVNLRASVKVNIRASIKVNLTARIKVNHPHFGGLSAFIPSRPGLRLDVAWHGVADDGMGQLTSHPLYRSDRNVFVENFRANGLGICERRRLCLLQPPGPPQLAPLPTPLPPPQQPQHPQHPHRPGGNATQRNAGSGAGSGADTSVAETAVIGF
ncbi:hypothetical protein JHW43_003716 [Diplocarpon mali]|nr:hypothetical protein JHW43_003716 [Diplocarpon mali]